MRRELGPLRQFNPLNKNSVAGEKRDSETRKAFLSRGIENVGVESPHQGELKQ